MTQTDYQKRYAEARRTWPTLTAKTRRKIKQAYTSAGELIAEVLRNGAIDASGNLDFETQRELEVAIMEGSAEIGRSIRENVPELVLAGSLTLTAIDSAFLTEAMEKAGVTKVGTKGIASLFDRVASSTVNSSLNFVRADGYNFWGRIPNISKLFGDDAVNFVRAGISQGRDLGKLAVDVTKYIQDGKKQTVHRWGDVIEPDSKRLLKRVPESVDYRALRLARSELGRAVQETGKEAGRNNPGALDLYDWIRINTQIHDCVCPDNAANGPYKYVDIPGYAHPNCYCIIRVRLRDGNDFREELKRWSNGEPNERLDAWYQSTYLPAQF